MKTPPFNPAGGVADRAAEHGSALVLSMFFMFLLTLAAASMTVMAHQGLFMNRKLVDRARAQEIANGTLEQSMGWIAKHPDNTAAELPSALRVGNLGADGAYTVDVTDFGLGMYRLLATGTVAPGTLRQTSQRVAAYVRRSNYAQAFGTAVFSNGNISVGGGYDVHSGGTHSNGNTTVFGSANVNGPTTAHGTCSPAPPGISGAAAIAFPLMDYNYYISKPGITVVNGNLKLNSKGSLTPSGGILYVKGDLTVNAQYTVNGMIIVTGSVKVVGQGLTVNPMGLPGIVAITGDIDLAGGSAVNGLVYTGIGQVTANGNSTINGSIIANGTCTLSGTGALYYVSGTDPAVLNDPKVHVLAFEDVAD